MNKYLVYGVYFMSLEKKLINLGEFTVLGVQKSIASYNNWLRTMVKIELFLPSKYYTPKKESKAGNKYTIKLT